MRRIASLCTCLMLMILFSCSEDDKAIDIVNEQLERGAVLRNIERISKDFIHQDFESIFSLTIEEQDLEEGDLLNFVRMYIAYEDRNESNGNDSTLETVIRDIPKSDFVTGEFGLPRTTINFSYQEAIDAAGINSQDILPGDQFKLRLELYLTDGRSFSTDTGSASILADYCFFKSPFRYEINIIEPIINDLFTGIYNYEIISNNVLPRLSIQENGIVSIISGDMPNVRHTGIIGEGLEFTIAGPNIFPKIYQSVNLLCLESGPHILSGPNNDSFGLIDLSDDTVFELDLDVGFEGWDGTLENGGLQIGEPTLYRIKFSKQ